MKLALTSDLHYGFSPKTDAKLRKFLSRLKISIEEQDIKALLIAGDSISSKQKQFKRVFEVIREYVNIPVLMIKGNHSFWQAPDPKFRQVFRNLEPMVKWQAGILKANDIHHLENSPVVLDDVLICGFDGWYAAANPDTNDWKYVPPFVQGAPVTMQYLSNKAWKDFEKCLELDTFKYRKSIIVTHHNLCSIGGHWSGQDDMGGNVKFFEEIKGKFDVLCYGHTHRFLDEIKEGVRVLNCGSDYNSPRVLIFEI